MRRDHSIDTNTRASGGSSLYDSPESQRPGVDNGEAMGRRRAMDMGTQPGTQAEDKDVSLYRDHRKF